MLVRTEHEVRAGSTPRSSSSKSKRDAQGVPFGWMSFARGLQSTKPVAKDRREFAIAVAKWDKIFKVYVFTYSLRQFLAPDSVRSTERVQLQGRVLQKAKGTHKASLLLFVKGLWKGYKILMGSFCKMGSLFIENGFTFLQKMGSNLTIGSKNPF